MAKKQEDRTIVLDNGTVAKAIFPVVVMFPEVVAPKVALLEAIAPLTNVKALLVYPLGTDPAVAGDTNAQP